MQCHRFLECITRFLLFTRHIRQMAILRHFDLCFFLQHITKDFSFRHCKISQSPCDSSNTQQYIQGILKHIFILLNFDSLQYNEEEGVMGCSDGRCCEEGGQCRAWTPGRVMILTQSRCLTQSHTSSQFICLGQEHTSRNMNH